MQYTHHHTTTLSHHHPQVEAGAGLKFSASAGPAGAIDRDGGGSVQSKGIHSHSHNHSQSQRGQARSWGEAQGEAEGRAEGEGSGVAGGNGEEGGEVEIDHIVNDNDGDLGMDFRGLILGLGERLSGVFRYQGMAKVTATTNQPEPTSSSRGRMGSHSYEPHPLSPLGKMAARNGNGFSPATTPATTPSTSAVGVGGDVAMRGPPHPQLAPAQAPRPSTERTGSYTVLGQDLEYTIKPEQYYPRPMEFTGRWVILNLGVHRWVGST